MAVRKPSAKPRAPRRKTSEYEVPEPVALTPTQARERYEEWARQLLGMSVDEFERKWAAGEFEGPVENQDAVAVWMVRSPRRGL